MREVKFRVWDAKTKILLSWQELMPPYNSTTLYRVLANHINEIFTLEQWTGLYDENGLEIYEGDVLAKQGTTEPLVVRWNKAIAGFEGHFISDMIECDTYYITENTTGLKVIGNIHERKWEFLE